MKATVDEEEEEMVCLDEVEAWEEANSPTTKQLLNATNATN